MHLRKTAVVCTLMLLMLHAAGLHAWAASDKIGFIDARRILQAHPKYESSQKHLDEFIKKKTAEARAAAEKETSADQRMIIIDKARRESGDEEMKTMNPITEEINKVIERVAKEKGVTIVLNSTLIYFGGVDLTEDVIKGVKALK